MSLTRRRRGYGDVQVQAVFGLTGLREVVADDLRARIPEMVRGEQPVATGRRLRASSELIDAISLAIVVFLMWRLVGALEPDSRLTLVGTAIVIFVFRAMPGPVQPRFGSG